MVGDDVMLSGVEDGDPQAIAALLQRHGRWLRTIIAAHLPPRSPLLQVEQSVWSAIKQNWTTRDPQVHLQLWLYQQARVPLAQYLNDCDRIAIAQRDSLTHLVIEASLSALGEGRYVSAGLIGTQVTALSPEQQAVINDRYRLEERQPDTQRHSATALCNARIACDWVDATATPFTDQSITSRLIEEWLSQTIDAASRGLLTTQVEKDLKLSTALIQQQRIHGSLMAACTNFSVADIDRLSGIFLPNTKRSSGSSIRFSLSPASGTGRIKKGFSRQSSSDRRPAIAAKKRSRSTSFAYLIAFTLITGGILFIWSAKTPSTDFPKSTQAEGVRMVGPSTELKPPLPEQPNPVIPQPDPAPVHPSLVLKQPNPVPPILTSVPASETITETSGTAIISCPPHSKDMIIGRKEPGNSERALAYYPDANYPILGPSGSKGRRIDSNVVIGYLLPTLPAGTRLAEATVTFNISSAKGIDKNKVHLDVYLLNTNNPDSSGTSLFYHGPSSSTETTKLVGSIFEGEIGAVKKFQIQLSGEALSLLQGFYGGDNTPDQPEAFFRFNLSLAQPTGFPLIRYHMDLANDQPSLHVKFAK